MDETDVKKMFVHQDEELIYVMSYDNPLKNQFLSSLLINQKTAKSAFFFDEGD